MNHWGHYKSLYEGIAKELRETPSDMWAVPHSEWYGYFTLTPIERWLWEEMRNNRMVMYPQYPIGGMFLDFANPKARVAIECDGAAYHTDTAKDEARDAWLNSQGWWVYRFPGSECWKEADFETGELSDGQKMLQTICTRHKVQRPVQQSGWLSVGLKPGEGARA